MRTFSVHASVFCASALGGRVIFPGMKSQLEHLLTKAALDTLLYVSVLQFLHYTMGNNDIHFIGWLSGIKYLIYVRWLEWTHNWHNGYLFIIVAVILMVMLSLYWQYDWMCMYVCTSVILSKTMGQMLMCASVSRFDLYLVWLRASLPGSKEF